MNLPPEAAAELKKMKPADRMKWADLEICRQAGDALFAYQWLIEKHRWIKDKAGKIRPLGKLKLAQKKTLAVLHYCRAKKIAPRIIIGKSRKQGESTIIAADCYEQVKKGQLDALIVSHSKDSVEKIFRIYQRYYKNDDLDKPEPYHGKLNLREMRFNNHDGHITVATAKNIYTGTGETPQYIHLSEPSKYERGAEMLTSLLQAIGDNIETTLVWESTFNGYEDCFLPHWQAAYENSKLSFHEKSDGTLDVEFTVTNHTKWNGYIPIFIGLHEDSDAYLPFIDDEDRMRFEGTLDEYERSMRQQFSIPLECLNWRRRTLKMKCKNDLGILKQEWCFTPEEAVRASGRPRFNIEKLDAMKIENGLIGSFTATKDWEKKIIWQDDPNASVTRFRPPVPGHHYLIGCDPVEGSDQEDYEEDSEEKLDAAVIEVFDLDYGCEEVC